MTIVITAYLVYVNNYYCLLLFGNEVLVKMLKTQQRALFFLFFNKRFATRMSNLWFKVTYIKVTYLFVGQHFVRKKNGGKHEVV